MNDTSLALTEEEKRSRPLRKRTCNKLIQICMDDVMKAKCRNGFQDAKNNIFRDMFKKKGEKGIIKKAKINR